MFTPTKLLLLGLILAVIWYGYRIIEKRNEAAKHKRDQTSADAMVDMIECKTCGAWVDAKDGCSICG
jgi:hypothetical protein